MSCRAPKSHHPPPPTKPGRGPGAAYQREPSGVRIAGSAISCCNSAAAGSSAEGDDLVSTFRCLASFASALLPEASIRETAVGVYCVPALDRYPASANAFATSARVRGRPLTGWRENGLKSSSENADTKVAPQRPPSLCYIAISTRTGSVAPNTGWSQKYRRAFVTGLTREEDQACLIAPT